MFKTRMAVFLIVSILLPAIWAKETPADPNRTDAQLFQEAHQYILEENWDAALTAFETFMQKYEKSRYFDDAHYWRCYAMEKTGAGDEDVFKCYQDLIKACPKSQWVDDAKRSLIAVAKRLSEAGKTEYGAVLKAMQKSENKAIALTAISALRQIGGERALDALAGLYSSTQQRAVREEIIFTISQFKSPKVVPSLTKIIKEDPDRHMREKALFWLSQKTQSKEAIKLMEHVALNDPNHEVREKAVFALSQAREGKGVDALKRIAGSAKDVAVREKAVFWMGQYAESKSVVQSLETIVRKDKDRRVREKALHVLAHQAPAKLGVPALINLVENQSDKAIREKAVFWIGQNAKTEQAIRCLEAVALEDPDAEIRKTALLALSHAPGGRGVKTVIQIGRTAKDAGTRREAVFWLGQRAKSEEIIHFLESAALKDADSEVRRAALHALSHAPDGCGIESLKKIATTSEDVEMRRQAVFWLGQRTKSEDVIGFLENIALKDANAEIRRTALLALSQTRDERGVKALMKIGGSAKDADTRERAIFWLGQQAGSEDVIQFLEKVVREDANSEVRRVALTALVHAHRNVGVPALINLAKTHPDHAIRREAIFWLGQSKDPRATEALVEIVSEMK